MFQLIKSFSALKLSSNTIAKYCTYNLSYNPALLPVKKTHRKPRWVPVAKSKVFRIPKKPKLPEDEANEIRRLFNNYKNNVRSIRKYLYKKHCTIFEISSDPQEILKEFKEDLVKCHEINDKWNAEVKINREARLQKELDEELVLAEKKIEEQMLREEEMYAFTEELVRKQKEASISFITPENIDAIIDKALAEETDYNFAIYPNGEKIIGKKTRPTQETEKVVGAQ
ncbi:hypothetical protein ABEB36_002854 [Hypothenemus hampei]|uniref:Small ribosomal subunit protein mS26 n=1 Tax=Hypothenemus hampei TaxID=57062 RepID=A0ABD1F772_HYPHA